MAMQSPFPGMDPYLEDPAFWRDFHHTFLCRLSEAIADRLPESYDVRLDETINVMHLTNADIQGSYPDIRMPRMTGPVEFLDKERQIRINILRLPKRELVTILELVSQTNKLGDGIHEYRAKRNAVLRQEVSLVELDLLLAGTRPPIAEPLPTDDYFAYISRADRRPDCEVFHWRVRQPLPTIPIPLKTPDADIRIDLGRVFRTTYQRGRYARKLLYGKPPTAPLGDADAAWAKRISTRK